MAIRLDTIVLTNDADLPIRVDLRRDPERPPRAGVIVAHGFKGFKRWGFFPYLGEKLAEAGYASCVFDFSMNGIGEDPEQFDRLDLFEQNTYSREIADLEQVVRWLAEESEVADAVGTRGMGLIGHSRGSIPTMVVAAEQERIAALVTWNGVGEPLRASQAQLRSWEEEGRMEFTNARTGQRMAMGYGFVVDAREHAGRFDPQAAAKRMKASHLILHGTRDMAVGIDEGRSLVAGREDDSRCSFVAIEGGTHTFGAVHPFAGTTTHLESAIERTIDWLNAHLDA